MRKAFAVKICAGLVALGTMTGAHAVGPQFEATMNWGSFSVTLTDLDLNDAVTPELQWTSRTTGASILMNGTLYTSPTVSDFVTSVTVSDGLSVAGADADSVSTAVSGLDGTLSFLEIYASRYGNFTLSPKTKVEFTLPVSASALGIPPGISLIGSLQLSANFTSFDAAGIVEGGTVSGRTLTASFSNDGISEATNISFSSGIIVNAYTAPVPEPGEWAMMVAGLGFIAAATARRRNR